MNAADKKIYINSETGQDQSTTVTIEGTLSDGVTRAESTFQVTFKNPPVEEAEPEEVAEVIE